MLNAIVAVHLRKGLWNSNGGFELPLVYAMTAAARLHRSRDLLPGSSVRLRHGRTAYGIGAIVLGLVAGLVALALRRRPQPMSRPEPVPVEATSVAEVVWTRSLRVSA